MPKLNTEYKKFYIQIDQLENGQYYAIIFNENGAAAIDSETYSKSIEKTLKLSKKLIDKGIIHYKG